ncbi:nuclear transport factor 2 family protein [Mycobacterium vicinigordonae]|uniref:Nuclear transport factor 2 family protein n=1 Tax=Mycobacterium vicinigordonae TaxID=1719132 RepID=A0A7D6DUZ7_9MYCO|nr:nuclear transport factor 2 family protein [Mycobacterium vicinigordonae]QLL05308.1 nuclear transport factor 2 family protein [Mycobacterium vicinigordonae]
MPYAIDPTKTFRLLEQRIANTTNPRHLQMLKQVLRHAVGEAEIDLSAVMSTLCAHPRYMAWGAPPEMSPQGRHAVQAFYEDTIVKGGQFCLELDIDRIVVDDDTIVTEGYFRSVYHGADAARQGFPADDPEGFYLLTMRMLIVWPFDSDGFIVGEETYSAITTPDFFVKIDTSEVPQNFRDFIADRPSESAAT